MPDPDRKIWDGVLAHLRKTHPALYRKWFEDELDPLGVAGGAMSVRVRSEIRRAYLHQNCLTHFNEALQAVTGALITVKFQAPDAKPIQNSDVPPSNGTVDPGTIKSDPSAEASLTVNPDFDFDSFVVGPSNRFAHAAATAVAEDPGRVYNPLFLHGDVGRGKTHLLQAICLTLRERDPHANLCYLSAEGFITRYVEAVRSGEMAEFRHRFRDVDILVIDDIQTLGAKDNTQEEFFHTFNSLYQARKQIVLSSDAPPELIPDLQNRLVSRFKWGVVIQIDSPGVETRTAILKTKARQRGIELSDDVALYVAQAISSNVRELEGAISTLQISATVDACDIDMELARKVIEGPGLHDAGKHLSIHTIIEAVTNYYDVRLSDLQSKRRARSVTIPRQVCMFLARKHTRHSLEEIGGYFGGRDHTTVMHAVRTTELRREQDQTFDEEVRGIEQKFLPSESA